MLGIKESMISVNQMIQKIQYFFSPASVDDEIEEQIMSATAQAVADIVKERQAKEWSLRKERINIMVI